MMCASYQKPSLQNKSKSGNLMVNLPKMAKFKRKGLFHTWKIKAKKNIEDLIAFNQKLDILILAERDSLRIYFSNGREKEYSAGITKFTKIIQLKDFPTFLFLWDDLNQELVYFENLLKTLEPCFKNVLFKVKGKDFINDINPMPGSKVAALSVDGVFRIIDIDKGVVF